MATFGTYNYADLIKTSSTEDIIFTLTDENSAPIDLTGISAVCQFRYSNETGKLAKDLSIGSGLTLTDAAAGKIKIDSFLVDFEVGLYYYDIKLTFSSSKIKTYIKGTLNVLQNVSTIC